MNLTNKKQVMERYGVTLATVNNWMKHGLPYYKIGSRLVRFDLSEVDEWLKRRCGDDRKHSRVD